MVAVRLVSNAGERSVSANFRGALWILASCAAAAVMSAGVKGLSPGIHSMQTAFVRGVFGILMLLPMLWHDQRDVIPRRCYGRHLLRGLLALLAVNLGFYSLTVVPLTTVTVLFFTVPLFVTLLAPLMIDETVGWRRLSATAVGFVGTIVVTRPTLDGIDPIYLIPVASSVCFSLVLLLGKQLSARDEPPLAIFATTTLTMTVGSMPTAASVWVWPDGTQMLLLLLVGVGASLRTYADIRAYAEGEASFVAAFQYLRIMFIVVIAYLIFHEVPGLHDYVGAGVIFASTLYIAYRERRTGSRAGAATASG